jgi:hypothetical protein
MPTQTCLCHCAADEGGAIYAEGTAHIKLQDTYLTRNAASIGGGLVLYANATGALRQMLLSELSASSRRRHVTILCLLGYRGTILVHSLQR